MNSDWKVETYWTSNETLPERRWRYGDEAEIAALVQKLLKPRETTFSITVASDPIEDRNPQPGTRPTTYQ
ncbi:MAG: hypothetical protein R3C11_21100 [Planctomycetaceae bacterium]